MAEGASYQFPTTQWRSVERAGEQNTLGRAALRDLLVRYLVPLRAHLLLHNRLPPDKADDLLQGFIADKMLEQDLVGCAARDKGRFRTFLLVALDRFASNQLRGESRQRGSRLQDVSLHDARELPDPDPSPSAAFEIAWARQVLAQAADRMREECDAARRPDIWAVYEARVLAPSLEGAPLVPYEQLIAQLGLPSIDAASNLLVTAKRMFARSLRGVVGEYMGQDGQIGQEIAELRASLSRAH